MISSRFVYTANHHLPMTRKDSVHCAMQWNDKEYLGMDIHNRMDTHRGLDTHHQMDTHHGMYKHIDHGLDTHHGMDTPSIQDTHHGLNPHHGMVTYHGRNYTPWVSHTP